MQIATAQKIPDAKWTELGTSFDVAANRENWLRRELSGVTADDVHNTWAKFHLAVHGTSLERSLSIIADGAIESHSSLERSHPEIVAQRLQNLTDALDIKLGLDRYVFLSVGRVHPTDVHPVYFLFQNSIAETPGSLVALREIVHFGALVSPEAADFYKRATGKRNLNVEKLNFNAASEFFTNQFSGSDFVNEIFPRFLQKHFSQVNRFTTTLLYPGASLNVRLADGVASTNAWEGPQLQFPGKISLGERPSSILVTSEAPEVISAIQASGFPRNRIYLMRDAVSGYQKRYGLKPYHDQLERGLYVNLALRDLALLPHHNRAAEGFPDSMAEFRNSI